MLVKIAYDKIVGQEIFFLATGEENLILANEKRHLTAVESLMNSARHPKILFETFVMGITPLHMACYCGHDKVVQRLLHFAKENEIDPNIVFVKHESEKTSLHLAYKGKHRHIISYYCRQTFRFRTC